MKLNDMLNKANKKLNINTDSIDSPWQLASSSNDSQTIVKGSSNDSQTIVKGSSNDSQTIVKGSSNDSQTIVKGYSNDSQTIVKVSSNDSQTIVKNNNKISIDDLSGLQLNILIFLIKNIENDSLKTTKQITIPFMSQALQSNKNMLVQGIYRLKKKGFIFLIKRKDGRGGWCKYKLHKDINIDLNSLEITYIYNNDINIINKKESKEVVTENDSSQKDESNTDWLNIDFSPLLKFGFKKAQITKFSKNELLTPEMVQESIYHYAWALDNNLDEMLKKYDARFEKNKLGLFIGTLNRGEDWVEAGYQSPEDIAQEEIFKAKKARVEKIKQQKLEMLNLDFELWYEELTKDDKSKVEGSFAASTKNMSEKMLKEGYLSYFKKNIYEG